MTREEAIEVLDKMKYPKKVNKNGFVISNVNIENEAIDMAINALSKTPCDISEYDKDHIWYKGCQYISLRRFLEVKAEAEKGVEQMGFSTGFEKCRTCKYGEIYNDLWCKCHDPLLNGAMVKMTDQCRSEEIIDINRKLKGGEQ